MADDQGEEKEHEATGKQRSKFRDDGEFPQSKDINNALMLTGGVTALVLSFGFCSRAYVTFAQDCLGDLTRPIDGSTLLRYIITWLKASAPCMITAVTLTIVTQLSQSKGYFSWKKLAPDVTKFNPLPQLKKMFLSIEALVTLSMSILKVSLIAGICAYTLIGWFPNFLGSEPHSLAAILSSAADVAITLGIRLVIVLLLIGVIDWIVNWYKLEKKMKMSTQDIKDEHKETDGSPEVKQKRRQKAYELSMQRSIQAVPEADVVVVNPTHFAVAIAYKPLQMIAPKVVAKGVDEHAARIRQIARRAGVPIVSQPPLARMLYRRARLGQTVPTDLYQAVALILAYVYKVRNRRRAG